MKQNHLIPFYAPDGASLGKRTLDAAKRLVAGGFVKPSYGRKGHLKAIWLRKEDGSNPVETRAPGGTKYSFLQNLDHGRCWKLRREFSASMRSRTGFLKRSAISRRRRGCGGLRYGAA